MVMGVVDPDARTGPTSTPPVTSHSVPYSLVGVVAFGAVCVDDELVLSACDIDARDGLGDPTDDHLIGWRRHRVPAAPRKRSARPAESRDPASAGSRSR